MANTRCYDSFNTILAASELSAQKRKSSIFTEVKKNIATLNTANPVKTNGYQYNQNTHINQTCDISSGKVAFANSYELLNAYKAGEKNNYPVQVSTPKYENWCGNLYSVNYAAHDISNVVQTDASFLNIVVDPSYLLFYDKCLFNYPDRNRPEIWTAAVDLSFQETYYARAANNSLHVCE